jgi:pyocin large subunit-like protein
MASVAPLTKLKSVDQDDAQIYHDFTRGDTEAVIDKDGETRQRLEPRVGLWFWAIE